jgi:hypothetical protein
MAPQPPDSFPRFYMRLLKKILLIGKIISLLVQGLAVLVTSLALALTYYFPPWSYPIGVRNIGGSNGLLLRNIAGSTDIDYKD